MSVAETIAARVNTMVAAADAGAPAVSETPVAESGDAPAEAADGLKGAPSEQSSPDDSEATARKARLALYEEKLADARAKRKGQRLAEQARAARKAAAADRAEAAKERAKYDGLKEGSFKETLTALGRDPMKAYEEMAREAIEATTPEGQAKRQEAREREREAALQKHLDEQLSPVQQELELLRKEKAEWAARTHEHAIASNFQREVADPMFADLRIEYADEALIEYVKHYDKNPSDFHAAAKRYGVSLTNPQGLFTMREILSVLKSAQDEHERGKQSRRPAQSPAEAQPGKPRTVNGTVERQNAGTAIGNDLASERASPGPVVTGSVRERLRARTEAEIRRQERR